MAWASDLAPGGKAGPTQGCSGAYNVPGWLKGVEPGSTSSPWSFKGWQWRWEHFVGDPCLLWRFSESKQFFLPLFLCPQLLCLGLFSFAVAKDCVIQLLLLYFLSHALQHYTTHPSSSSAFCCSHPETFGRMAAFSSQSLAYFSLLLETCVFSPLNSLNRTAGYSEEVRTNRLDLSCINLGGTYRSLRFLAIKSIQLQGNQLSITALL